MSVLRERFEVQKMLRAMKVKYIAPKPMRLDNQFLWITCYIGLGWRFCLDTKRWLNGEDSIVSNYTFFAPCRSVRAFRRRLKKAPAGIEFVLCSRFIGKDVIGYGSGDYSFCKHHGYAPLVKVGSRYECEMCR